MPFFELKPAVQQLVEAAGLFRVGADETSAAQQCPRERRARRMRRDALLSPQSCRSPLLLCFWSSQVEMSGPNPLSVVLKRLGQKGLGQMIKDLARCVRRDRGRRREEEGGRKGQRRLGRCGGSESAGAERKRGREEKRGAWRVERRVERRGGEKEGGSWFSVQTEK